jgi:hypothetical protein
MTTAELAEYYANLLIMQYHDRTKAVATIKGVLKPLFMDQLPVAVQDAYDVETAVGVQLDVLGKYVGVSRSGYGLDGPITLDDSDYRQLIKMVLIKNNSGSSLATIQSLLAGAFPGQVFVSDNQVMGLNYVIVESLGTSDLLELLVTGGYLPRPMGVSVSATIVPEHDDPFFGFRTYAAPDTSVSPFNNYPFYQLTYPWLSYGGVD